MQTQYSIENLPGVIDDTDECHSKEREREREKVREAKKTLNCQNNLMMRMKMIMMRKYRALQRIKPASEINLILVKSIPINYSMWVPYNANFSQYSNKVW